MITLRLKPGEHRCHPARMNVRVIAAVGTLVVFDGCSALQRRPSGPPELTLDPANTETWTTVDRVGPGDRTEPDGRPDANLVAHVRGTVRALILTVCDEDGHHTGAQWDTIVGQDTFPEGFINRFGVDTWVLGIFGPDGRMINRDDGSMPETDFPQTTTLQLYVSMREALQSGRTVCLTALRPEGAALVARAELR